MGAVAEAPTREEIERARAAVEAGGDGLDPDLAEDAQGQFSFVVGGKQPTSTALSIVGGKIEVGGEFEKGETVVLRIEARVHSVEFVDERDGKTGNIVGCQRRHKARPVSVTVER